MKYFVLLLSLLALSLASIENKVNDFVKEVEFELEKELADEFLLKFQQAQASSEVGEITAIVNDYADKVFDNIHTFSIANGLDPILLSNVSESFLDSSITLTNGQLKGISTISRAKDVTVTYRSDARELEIYLPIVFSNLNFTYDYEIIILLLGPKGEIIGKISHFEMDLKLLFDFNTYHAKLLQAQTINSGHVDVVFTGNGLVDLVVNILSEFVTTILHPLIVVVIEGVVTAVGNTVVDAVNDFVDGILIPTTTETPLTTSGLF